ncbi:MAG TPA: VOC family protein, partial [Polyangiaceae bacterium]
RRFYEELFGWKTNVDSPVAKEVSEPGNYGFLDPQSDSGVAGGIGGGKDYKPHALFYVGVPDVAEALAKAEALGGKRVMGPAKRPDGKITLAQFTDPEGNLIGVAGPK